MRKLIFCIAVAQLFAVMLAAPCSAFYFLDSMSLLREETKGEIYAANQRLEEACGAQIAVAVLEDIGGASIEKYAMGMRDLWGVGDAERENGFLLLITISNGEYCAIAGHGHESALPKDEIARLLDEYFAPDFEEGDCDGGVRKLFAAVFKRISEFYGLDADEMKVPFEDAVESADPAPTGELSAVPIGIISLGFLALGWMLLRRQRR